MSSKSIKKITSYVDLCKIGNDPAYPFDGHYEQIYDIDASLSKESEAGFWPILDYDDNEKLIPFSGTYDGRGHFIENLCINSPRPNKVGLFASLSQDAEIRNVKIVDATVMGKSEVGILAGHNLGNIINCSVAGNVRGENIVGGIAGNNMGNIEKCSVSGHVFGKNEIGGIAGQLFGDYVSPASVDDDADACLVEDDRGVISCCEVTADVKGKNSVGGIVGLSVSGQIIQCHAKSKAVAVPFCMVVDAPIKINGNSSVGGIAGHCIGSFICDCEIKADLVGENFIGGIVGSSDSTLGTLVDICRSTYSSKDESRSLLGFYGDVRAVNNRDILNMVCEYCEARGIELRDFISRY